ncbi:hypothetical protein UFOVP223_87 [uncultured Caudovirales phage]|uniref:Bacteriophage lambda, Stf, side tail fibre-repeat-2 n=1 Tax=uncultured Caudovirales phage TaxID=2100421 RepID=A0A6J7WNA6_9CAUD|nr:hypothetical protein UFOVP110_77 [uncultured Caudovirales phage]CAB5219519.1 hypothetical protein UFOVP223_87 [uncultured Caudovirales phage]
MTKLVLTDITATGRTITALTFSGTNHISDSLGTTLVIASGAPSSGTASGVISIKSGNATAAASGAVSIFSGTTTTSGSSGSVYLNVGTSAGTAGGIGIGNATVSNVVVPSVINIGPASNTTLPININGAVALSTPLLYSSGGTGLSSYAKGDILYASAANTLSSLAIPATNGYVLTYNSTTGLPNWAAAGSGSLGYIGNTQTTASAGTTIALAVPSISSTTGNSITITGGQNSQGTGSPLGGPVSIIGGTQSNASPLGTGGAVNITGGSSGANGQGGSVTINGGLGGGNGNGTVNLGTSNTDSVQVGAYLGLKSGIGLGVSALAGTSGQVLTSSGSLTTAPTWTTPGSMTLISTTTTAAGATSATLSSIPQTYKSLKLKIWYTGTVSGPSGVSVTFNGTTANYHYGYSSQTTTGGASGGSVSGAYGIYQTAAATPSVTALSPITLLIENYTSTTVYKTWTMFSVLLYTASGLSYGAGAWNNAAAVTSIGLSFAPGASAVTNIELYGVN